MCQFFSLVTVPSENKKLYFDWKQRVDMKHSEDCDSHSSIIKHYGVDTNAINCYEYNPLAKVLTVDCINGTDDQANVKEWLDNLDWKTIVEPLIVKPIINPFELPEVTEVTEHHIELLKKWAYVWTSVWAYVWDSVGDSVWAYTSSFFNIEYKYDFSSAIELWESGLVPSFNNKTWRLHTGEGAKIVYEWSK